MEQPEQASTKAGFVALIGAPNAGKSTLLNSLVGSKVSIVSRKVQTTRALVRGIAIEGEAREVGFGHRRDAQHIIEGQHVVAPGQVRQSRGRARDGAQRQLMGIDKRAQHAGGSRLA